MSDLRRFMKRLRRVKDRAATERHIDRFLRSAMDIGNLHDCRGGNAGSAARPVFAYRHPEVFRALIDMLVQASASYLIRQIEAGVDAVQIFDTWAGVVATDEFERWCVGPASGSPRRSGARTGGQDYRLSARRRQQIAAIHRCVPVDAVGLDWTIDPEFAREQSRRESQFRAISIRWRFLAGGKALDRAVDRHTGKLSRLARLSSISATASCRTRRSRMSSNWSRGCGAT